MTAALVVARKELTTYFLSPIAYVFLVIFTALTGFWVYQVGEFFTRGVADARPLFALLPWAFMVLVPAMTMRLWAEERKLGTIEVLLTAPIRTWEAVLGKFLASWALLGVALVLTFAIPISVATLGNLDLGPVIGGYVGAFLMGGAFLALGCLLSSTTENQIVAFVVAVFVNFLLIVVGEGDLLGRLPLLGWLAEIGPYLGIAARFESIGRGVVDLRDLLYYASLIGFFLYVNAGVIEARRKG